MVGLHSDTVFVVAVYNSLINSDFKAELLYVELEMVVSLRTICLSIDKAMNQNTTVVPEHPCPKITEPITLS